MTEERIIACVENLNTTKKQLQTVNFNIQPLEDESRFYKACVVNGSTSVEWEVNQALTQLTPIVSILQFYEKLFEENIQPSLLSAVKNLRTTIENFSIKSQMFTIVEKQLAPSDIVILYKKFHYLCALITNVCHSIPDLKINDDWWDQDTPYPVDHLVYVNEKLFKSFSSSLQELANNVTSFGSELANFKTNIENNQYYGFHKIIVGALPSQPASTVMSLSNRNHYVGMLLAVASSKRPIRIEQTNNNLCISIDDYPYSLAVTEVELANFLKINCLLTSNHIQYFPKKMLRSLLLRITCQNERDPQGRIHPNIQYFSNKLRLSFANHHLKIDDDLSPIELYSKNINDELVQAYVATLPLAINHLVLDHYQGTLILYAIPQHITTLTLDGYDIATNQMLNPTYFGHIVDVLPNHIEHLNIVYNNKHHLLSAYNTYFLQQFLFDLADSLKKKTHIKTCTLEISSKALTDITMSYLYSRFPKFVTLRVSNPSLRSLAFTENLFDNVPVADNTHLLAGNLANGMTADDALYFIYQLKIGPVVDLSHNPNFKKELLFDIIPYIPSHFCELDISHNDFATTCVFDVFCELMKVLPQHVTQLNLSDNALGRYPIDSLMHTFKHLITKLCYLNLANNSLYLYGVNGMIALLASINTKRIILDLRGNQLERFGKDGLQKIFTEAGFHTIQSVLLDPQVVALLKPIARVEFCRIVKAESKSTSLDTKTLLALKAIFKLMPEDILDEIQKMFEVDVDFEIQDLSIVTDALVNIVEEDEIFRLANAQTIKRLHYMIGHELVTNHVPDMSQEDIMLKMTFAKGHLEAAKDFPGAKDLLVNVKHFVDNAGQGFPIHVAPGTVIAQETTSPVAKASTISQTSALQQHSHLKHQRSENNNNNNNSDSDNENDKSKKSRKS